MGNSITHHRYSDAIYVGMSNGLTESFFVTLALSSSALAQTPYEYHIALWIAQHDQSVRGYGSVSFDLAGATLAPARLSTFPWTYSRFVAEKTFLLSVIEDALLGERWYQVCSYKLHQDVFDTLAKFRHMIKRCREQDLNPETSYDLPATVIAACNALERCSIHGVLLHEVVLPEDRQCIVCNSGLCSASI